MDTDKLAVLLRSATEDDVLSALNDGKIQFL